MTASINAARRAPTVATLLLGSGLVFMTFMRFNLAELGWIVFAPFLVYLHENGTRRAHLVLLATLIVALVATVSKMATWEIPWIPVPMFALPLAISNFVAIAVASLVHRRLGPSWSAWTFASMATVMSWMQYTFTPGSSWGALAYTQRDNLPLVQLVSLTGLGGVTFIVALGSGLVAAAWCAGFNAVRRDIIVFGALLVAALVYGQIRLSRPAPGTQVRLGAVSTPVTHRDFHAAAINIDTLRQLDDQLFARSARAAELGARAVVWDEVATFVTRQGEDALTARGRDFARDRGVLLVMAYGVVESLHPFHYINKFRIYLPDGTLGDEYIKRHPVPGDPNTPGTAHARAVSFEGVKYIGAICYDYGFPRIAFDNARDGGDVALVPSSDWTGIDPEHGRMAMMNAVAAGLPMVRPVRAATSIATDQYGRLVGTLRWDGSGDGVLVAAVPTQRVRTLYSRTGEVVPWLALAFGLFTTVRALRARAGVSRG